MLTSILCEDDILDKLDQQSDILGLLTVAVELFHISVYELILKVFRKENHAINFVIPSLIERDGPLNHISVRLRLLYALGLLTREEYDDIDLLVALLDELKTSEIKYNFMDDEILCTIGLLHNIVLPKNPKLQENQVGNVDIIDEYSISLQQNRYQNRIRSALILAITSRLLQIINKQQITYFP